MKEVLGFAAVGFELVSLGFYFFDIYRGNTKPHLFTMLVWGIVTSVIFFGQVTAGAGAGAWATGLTAASMIVLVVVSYFYGTKDITRSDGIALMAALAAIGLWIITKDPLLSVALAVLIDIWGIIPTYRKSWYAPYSESLMSWWLAEAKLICAFAALSVYSFTTWIYPVEAFVINGILIAILLVRRSRTELIQ